MGGRRVCYGPTWVALWGLEIRGSGANDSQGLHGVR